MFEEDGDFLFAFGWGVDTGAAELETCTAASGCQAGLPGSGAGQFDKPTKVAVDNEPASPNHHFVYVVDPRNFRVELFDPTSLPAKFVHSIGSEGEGEGQLSAGISIDVGPGGVLHVLDNLEVASLKFKHRLQRFKPNGEAIPPQCIFFEGVRAESIAVDSSGSFWVAGAFDPLRKYNAGCALQIEETEKIQSLGVAFDEAGNLFALQREQRDNELLEPLQVITAYDAATGAIRSRFAYGRIPSFFISEGLAVRNGGEGGIFVAVREEGNTKRIRRLDFPPPPPTLPSPGPIPAPPSLEVKNVGSVKATALAEVNPEGKATGAHFEYLTQKAYEEQGESFTGAQTKSTPTVPLGAEGFNLKTTEALLGCPNPAAEAGKPGSKCLAPETAYRFRVVATNPDGPGEGTAQGPPFTTQKSLELGETYATEVGTDSAQLHAEVNPLGVPATGYFEYVDDAHFQESGFAAATKVPDPDQAQAPLDFGFGEAFATRQASIYPLAPGTLYHYRLIADNPLVEPVAGEAHTLRTFALQQAQPCPANDASRIGPGAFLPDCRAYEMVSPVDKAGGDIRVLSSNQGIPLVLEQSSLSGEKLAYGSIRSFGDAASTPFISQYIARRIEGEEWETHSINSPRGRPNYGALAQFDIEFKAFSADLCDVWQTTFSEPPLAEGGLAGYQNLYRRTDGLCADDGKAHYEALAPIAEPPSIPPGLKPAGAPEFFIEPQDVSADGEHAVFLANDELLPDGSKGQRQLYEHARGAGVRFVCILPEGGVPVSGSCTAGSADLGSPGPQIGRISSDGERIFWSTPAAGEAQKIYMRIGGTQTVAVSKGGEEQSGTKGSWFWGAAADGSRAIFSTRHPEAGVSDLYEFDIEGETTTPIADGVLGVMGISKDANHVYFASKEVLSEEANSNGDKAQPGKANLYLREAGGGTEFIATLGELDLEQAVKPGPFHKHTARVSPDGAHAAFVSVAPLTGYDNKGAQSGVPTAEVYRYDAAANELSCVSCNPSGARPAGASSIPFWENGMHAARVLSDDGARLYFQSADALTARDTNGGVDVYQWEELGAGGCDEADVGFSAAAGGCVELISSGQSPQDSRFVESSPSGDDVFFATGASLLPQDPGVFDIYDARVQGGLPIPQPPPPSCEGEACQSPAEAPNDPTPASSAFQGTGNVIEGAKLRCRKPKVRRKGRCVARKHHKRARRAKHNRRAAR